jgi:hypothetical protein
MQDPVSGPPSERSAADAALASSEASARATTQQIMQPVSASCGRPRRSAALVAALVIRERATRGDDVFAAATILGAQDNSIKSSAPSVMRDKRPTAAALQKREAVAPAAPAAPAASDKRARAKHAEAGDFASDSKGPPMGHAADGATASPSPAASDSVPDSDPRPVPAALDCALTRRDVAAFKLDGIPVLAMGERGRKLYVVNQAEHARRQAQPSPKVALPSAHTLRHTASKRGGHFVPRP